MNPSPTTTAGSYLRWRALLLSIVFNLFMFESLSGFVLFFSRGLVSVPASMGAFHWWLGVALCVPYSVYQWRHYMRVRGFKDVLQYQVGLITFFIVAAVVVSGVLLYFATRGTGSYTVIDLFHIMLGFAFLILISSHLVLVYRVGARESAAKGITGFQPMVLFRAVWLPLASATVLTVAAWLAGS
jgi:hypothetical protein